VNASSEHPSGAPPSGDFVWPAIRAIAPGAARRWLRAGWNDFAAQPVASLFYGVVLAAMGALLTRYSAGAIGLALTTGFLLVGPFLAIGIYSLSRQRELHGRAALAPSLTAWRANFPSIGLYALLLTLLLAVWIRVSLVIVAAFFPPDAQTLGGLLRLLARSPEGWLFAAVYLAAGAVFALLVFATSAVSLPMLLARPEMDTLSAMITSFNALRRNFRPMLVWGVTIVALTLAGFATWGVGLVVIVPLIGHATWHAYRELIE
jgi:uncharacterized membrane protein